MVQTFRILFLILNIIFIFACKKENTYDGDLLSNEPIVLNAAIENEINSRVGFTDTDNDGVKVWWQKGATDADYSDSFSVYNTTTGAYMGDFIYNGTHGANAGSFIQATEFSLPTGDYTAVFPAVDAATYPTLAQRDAMPLDEVDGMLFYDLTHLNKASRMRAEFSYNSSDSFSYVRFNNELTMIKLNFKKEVSWQKPTYITVEDDSSTVKYNFSADVASNIIDIESYLFIRPQTKGNILTISVNLSGGTTNTLSKHTMQLNHDLSAGMCYEIDVEAFNHITPIYTPADLQNVRNNLSGNYVLMNDIDLSSISNWTPIGSTEGSFVGSLNGNGYTISNLTVTSNDYSGLFGYSENASLYNLTISSANVTGTDYTGGLVGSASSTKIWDVTMRDVEIIGSGSVGGVVGRASTSAYIRDCSVGGVISGRDNVGGIAGLTSQSSMINCTSSVIFNNFSNYRTHYMGGIVGAVSSSTIVACAYTGLIDVNYSGSIFGAGVVGEAISSKIVACYNIGIVNFRSAIAGILALSNGGTNTIYGCFSTATLNYNFERNNQNGGIVGDDYSAVMCYGNFWLDQSGDDVTQPVGGSNTYSGVTIVTTHSSLVLPGTIAEMNQAIEDSGVKGVRYVAGISYPELRVDASVTID